MAIQTRKYAMGTELTVSYPWGVNVSGRAICPDGKVRALARIAQTADTFFSIPAAVKVNGKTVSGYVTIETLDGYSTDRRDDPAALKFVVVKGRKNSDVFGPDSGAWRRNGESV